MLDVIDVYQTFESMPVLRRVSLTVEQGEIICILGKSGSGKTTLLRVIAGLEMPERGDVRINGESVLRVPVHARDFGLMFQDFALFPHLNVEQNVMFGLKTRGIDRETRQQRAAEVLELVGLSGFEKRSIDRLSGGERQRVALARSLAPNPRLLMFDEPLGSVDAALRDRLVVELREIIKAAGLTALYVTHDQQEAFAVADRVAILDSGRFVQIDTPQALYRAPQTAFAARFLGLNNIVPVREVQDGVARTALGDFPAQGEPYALLLHPDGLRLDSDGALHGQVTEAVFRGGAYRVTVRHESGAALTFDVPATVDVPPVGAWVRLSTGASWVIPLADNNT